MKPAFLETKHIFGKFFPAKACYDIEYHINLIITYSFVIELKGTQCKRGEMFIKNIQLLYLNCVPALNGTHSHSSPIHSLTDKMSNKQGFL